MRSYSTSYHAHPIPLASIFCRISLETSRGTSGELSSLGGLCVGERCLAPLRRVCGASCEKAGRRRCVRAESDPSTKGRRVSWEMLNLMRVSVLSGGDYTPEERGFSIALRVLEEGMGDCSTALEIYWIIILNCIICENFAG